MTTSDTKQYLTDFRAIYITQALFNGCFYGIRAIFVLFAINQFSLNEAQAISLFATFMTLSYATSLIGGYLADKGLGVKNTIVLGGIFSTLGLLCILFPSQDLCLLGLALTSLGSGFIKPNISAAIGLLYKNPKDPQKERAYSLLYISMNVGSFIATLVCGFLGKACGWHYGIALIAAIFIAATFFVYKTMRFHFSYEEKPVIFQGKFCGIIFSLICLLYLLFKHQASLHSLMSVIACGSLIYFGVIFYHCQGQERKNLSIIYLYILLFTLFCALFEQAGTSLMLFYEKAVNRDIMGTVIPSSAFLSLDPLFVLLCGPLLLFLSGRYFEKTKPMNGFVKMGIGFSFAALSFWILALSTHQEANTSISILWIVGAMLAQTVGELWVAPISFAKISQYAPARYKSILMSFWPMAIAYGHFFGGFIAQYSLSYGEHQSFNHSLGQYQSFFIDLAILALCVNLSLILYWGIYAIYGLGRRRIF